MIFMFATMQIPSFSPVVSAMILVIQAVFVFLRLHMRRLVAITSAAVLITRILMLRADGIVVRKIQGIVVGYDTLILYHR